MHRRELGANDVNEQLLWYFGFFFVCLPRVFSSFFRLSCFEYCIRWHRFMRRAFAASKHNMSYARTAITYVLCFSSPFLRRHLPATRQPTRLTYIQNKLHFQRDWPPFGHRDDHHLSGREGNYVHVNAFRMISFTFCLSGAGQLACIGRMSSNSKFRFFIHHYSVWWPFAVRHLTSGPWSKQSFGGTEIRWLAFGSFIDLYEMWARKTCASVAPTK